MDNSEMLALIGQMNEKLTRIEARQRAVRRKNLILLGCVVVLIIALVIVAAPTVKNAIEQYNKVAAGIDKVSAVIDNIDTQKVQVVIDTVEGVDLQMLKEKLDKMTTIVDSLSKLKVDNLNTVVEGLNSIMDKLTKFFK